MHFLETYLRQSVEMRERANIHVPEGFLYNSIEDFVLKNGQLLESSALTDDEAELVQEVLDSARARGVDVHEFKQCFANAQSFVLEGDTDDFTYFEGYATGRACFPIHHGWVAINGKVIDLTWTLERPASRSLLPNRPVGELPEGWAYFGVPVRELDYLRTRVIAREMIGSLLDDWEGNYPFLRGIDLEDEEAWSEM